MGPRVWLLVTVKREISSIGKNLEIALKDLSGKVARVGWFEKSKYDAETIQTHLKKKNRSKDFEKHKVTNIPVAAVAAQNEYGNPEKHIPPRSFMRTSIIEKENEWRALAESGSRSVLVGKSTVYDVMEKIGLKAAGDIRKKITRIFEPPLSPVTIAARKAKRTNKKTTGLLTKPLIDTGIMLNTLTNTVEDK